MRRVSSLRLRAARRAGRLGAPSARSSSRAAQGARVSVDLSTWSLIDDALPRARPALRSRTRLRHRARAGGLRPTRRPSGSSSAVLRGVTVDGVDHPAHPVEAVDPTGAGDAFAAGYLVGGVQLGLRGRCSLLREARCDAVIRVAEEVAGGARGGPRRRRARDDARRPRLPAGRGHRGRARLRARGARRPAPCRRPSGCSTARSSSGSTRTSSRASTRPRARSGRATSPPRWCRVRSARRRSAGRSPPAAPAGMPVHGDGRARRRPPRLARLRPDVSADLDALAAARGARRLVGREVAARRAGDRGAARDARRARCSAGGRTSCRSSTRHTAARRCRRASRTRAEAARIAAAHWAARRRRAAPRPAARRQPRRRRAADRAGARATRTPRASAAAP